MSWFRGFALWVAAAVAVGVVMRAGAAPQYQFVDFFPNGGYPDTNASATGAYLGPSGPQQVGYAAMPDGSYRGMLWSGSPASAVVFTPPAGFGQVRVYGGYSTPGGGEQVGQADNQRALLWRGTADSLVDLGPGGARGGYAVPGGSRQVGTNNISHAALWSGSAASVADLNPAGYDGSVATGGYYAATGERQFGYAYHTLTDIRHAFLWSGTTASAIDLHPTALGETFANSATDGGAATANGAWQVGWAGNTNDGTGDGRALLWTGSAASAVDLTPAGLAWAVAHGTNGSMIVGEGGTGSGRGHALLWTSPDPASVIDLQQFLPSQYTTSAALGIDAEGNIVGYATVGNYGPQQTGYLTAVTWLAVPEPASVAWVALAGMALAGRQSRRGRGAAYLGRSSSCLPRVARFVRMTAVGAAVGFWFSIVGACLGARVCCAGRALVEGL